MAVFSFSRQTSFADSDAAGLIHFSRLACYVEEAEHAFLQKAGIGLGFSDPEALRWPRVQFSADFLKPIRPFETVEVLLLGAEAGNSSLRWTWEIQAGEEVVARGEMKTVCCREEHGRMRSFPLPEAVRTLVSE